ncbi:MAG: orotidine-5'-phosphate decarboxylase [Acidobacteriota bacterium]
MSNGPTPNPVIVALDVATAAEARAIVNACGDSIGFYKVGMELYAAEGMPIVRELIEQGKDVFLDLKFYDIPETVKRATAQVAKAGVKLLTVHASKTVMRAAMEGKGEAKGDSALRILGVTVLTSFDETDLADLGYTRTPADLVRHLVAKGIEANVDGFVCSPLEVAEVRAATGPGKILVTPGVRPAGSDTGDQKRVATPAQAIANGASYLVIGRPITRAADPAQAARNLLLELAV